VERRMKEREIKKHKQGDILEGEEAKRKNI